MAKHVSTNDSHFLIQWLILGLALLVLGGASGSSIIHEYKHIDTLERERLTTQAKVVDANLDRQLVALSLALMSIRNDLPYWKAQKDSKTLGNRHLQAMSDAMPGVRTLLITDAEGTVFASNRKQLIGLNFREREYFLAARRGLNPAMLYVSPPFKTVLGVFAMNVVRVVLDARGRFAGIVSATLDPGFFSVLLNSVLYTPGMRASLIHGGGKIFVEVPDRKDLSGMDLAKPGSRYSLHVKSGQTANLFAAGMAHSTGDERMSAWRTIRPASLLMDTPLMISVNRDMQGIFASWRREASIQGGLFGVLVLASVFGLYLYQQRQQKYETVRKRAEEEREKLQAQLLQAQKMESVGRLAGGVAHDFNNMLGVILGQTELALMRVDAAHPLHTDLMEIRNAAERSADLTRQLLAFARKQTIAPKVLDLNETVEGMLKMLRRLIGENIHLTWQPKANLWPVRVDPSQIDQILANLCVNARAAIADVGTLTIETGNAVFDDAYCADHAGAVPGEYVRLSVRDTGAGMDQDTLGHIFEPFFTTKELGKGTGIGLATVYGIVKQNNGFITADSELGHGTTFTLYLPRHVGKAGQARAAGAADPAQFGHETILLVEDEPAILTLTTRMLETQGYTVLAARTPGEALRLAREHAGEIHLLLTDVVMPEMNGRDLAKTLLALYPQLKRLFMSGYTADVIAHHGVLEAGVHFIQKPFSIQDLAAKVREALESE